jgi:hypothetical protein
MPHTAENRDESAHAEKPTHGEPLPPLHGGSNGSNDSSGKTNGDGARDAEKKPTFKERCQSSWTKTGITWPVFKLMFKGALAPTIAVALFQADDFASHFSTVGYLVGITSILSLVIQPRSKFLQTMLVNVVFVCFAAACVTLALYCCVQARIHSGESGRPSSGGSGTSGLAAQGAQTAPYNSSAAAVAGIWLMVMIYCMSTVRAAKPQFMIPAMAGAIIGNVGMVYAPQFSSMLQAEAFVKRLLEAFLTGFGIGTGVSLLIFPLTSRTVVFNDMSAYLTSLRSALSANMDYVHSLENTDMFTFGRTDTMRHRVLHSPEAQFVKDKMQALQNAAAKLNSDLPFAKREIALGNLGPDDLQSIAKLLRMIMLPMVGLSCISDIFERIAEDRGWVSIPFDDASSLSGTTLGDLTKRRAVLEWHELMRALREPFQEMADVIDEGLEHAMIDLRLSKVKKPDAKDVEAKGGRPRPGDTGFAEYLNKKTSSFHQRKQSMLQAWCRIRGIELPDNFFTDPEVMKNFQDPDWLKLDFDPALRARSRRQLYICLYMEFLLWSIGRRVYDLVSFAETARVAGKLEKKRLIVPGSKTLKKWVFSFFEPDADSAGNQQMEGSDQTTRVHLGSAFTRRKDPMHLPPQNAWERIGDRIRKLAQFFGSPESVFGARVALATMCIAVVAYLRHTQVFYTQNRLFWAQIMTSIGMQPSAGQSLRSGFFRIIGTALFMIAAWICWYIVDSQTAGVIVFYFIFLHIGPWIMLKYPAYTTLGVIGPITMTLILGYELQVHKIGLEKAQSNGQAYQPVYLLGPIRLATVIGGLSLGWLWTIFPYPVSEHAELRKSLGSALYLLANYYSVMHETVRARIRGLEDDPSIKGSVSQRLEKARRTIFGKSNLLLSGMRARTEFVKFDIPLGGKFPKKQYEVIIDRMQSMLNFMALVSYASTSFQDLQRRSANSTTTDDSDHHLEWLLSFRKLIGETNVTSQAITTLLTLMSASVANGQPLPPYLRVPEPFRYTEKLDEMDRDLLSVRHIAEPGYATFSVTQLGVKCVIDDLKVLLEDVRGLVGELDFSFHVVSTAEGVGGEGGLEEEEETVTFGARGGGGRKID